MFKIYECQNAKSNIIELKVLSDSLVAYCTESHGVEIFDFNSCKIKKTYCLNPPTNICSFSPNLKLFAFINNQLLCVSDIESNELIYTAEVHDEEIVIISFDLSSSYIIAGTKQGKVLQYKINSSSHLFKLYTFACDRFDSKNNNIENFITAFAFYEKKFACSSYDGAIFVMDLLTKTNKNLISSNKARITALCFLDENTLLSANDNGKVDIFSLNRENSFRSIATPILDIKQIIIMPNPNYIMISGNSNVTTIIDIKNFKIAHSKYIKFHAEINKIALLNNNSLLVALRNNKILHVELPGITTLKSLILHNSFEKAFELIEKEPMLQGSQEHKKLEEMFQNSYEDALKALIDQKNILAIQILDAYKDIKCKQAIIRDLYHAFKYYPRFQELFLEKKYTLAYVISFKFEPLKKTPEYKKMEDIFKLVFLNAQRHVMQNNLSRAKDLLSEYSTVATKKPLIKLLLTQNREFVDLLKAIQRRDFQTVYRLVDKNELLKQIPNYVTLNTQIQESLQEIEAEIKIGKISKAEALLLTLEGIGHISEKVEDLHKKCQSVLLLKKAYEESDFKSCYEILDMHDYLKSVELGLLLEKHWFKLVLKCEEFALVGNIEDIQKTVGEFIDLRERSDKIRDLLRVGFHVRIGILADKKDLKSAETAIYVYIDEFGVDKEIEKIMKKFEKISSHKLALTQTNDEVIVKHR
ncbi:MAG: hypothetical protein A2540_03215 [Sulfurimonas sp. RIFOXYD2_FULL_37_8]|nr:MAG: hypothetical protein A2540_03215 [Sulfurimonas sp. RIFOXYD2_FULL_37_8]